MLLLLLGVDDDDDDEDEVMLLFNLLSILKSMKLSSSSLFPSSPPIPFTFSITLSSSLNWSTNPLLPTPPPLVPLLVCRGPELETEFKRAETGGIEDEFELSTLEANMARSSFSEEEGEFVVSDLS